MKIKAEQYEISDISETNLQSKMKLINVKLTQIEMMADRGYIIPEKEIDRFRNIIRNPDKTLLSQVKDLKKKGMPAKQIADYIKHFNSKLIDDQPAEYEKIISDYHREAKQAKVKFRAVLNQTYKHAKTGESIFVYYARAVVGKPKLSKAIFSIFTSALEDSGSKHGLMISANGLSTTVETLVHGLTDFTIEIFYEFELVANPTASKLVNPHYGLSIEEAQALCRRNTELKPENMPKLLTSDIICRYYKFKVGQIVKIDRFETVAVTVRKYETYRCVNED